ncbi:MAG: DUF721 domain-containing protein [Sedimentisphaerales bacterium]|nr:DUF721 domain-containing protein [Sedimentisphaerales bacterium]
MGSWKVAELLMDKGTMRQLWQLRQPRPPAKPLKKTVDNFMRLVVRPRQRKLSKLAQAWSELLPDELIEHSCLEGYRAGTLRVLVDSAAHLAEMNLLLREGLEEQLRELCPRVSLTRVKLVRGYWYHTDEEGNRIPNF